MKILLTVLLFISATAAINNLVGIPDERFQQIEHILKGIQFIYLCSSFSVLLFYVFTSQVIYPVLDVN